MELSLRPVVQPWVYFAQGGAAPTLRERSFSEGSMTSMLPLPVGKLPLRGPLTFREPAALLALHTPLSPFPRCLARATVAARRVRNLLPSATSDSVCRSDDCADPRGVSRVNLGPGAALRCEKVQHIVRPEPKPDQHLTRALSPVCDSEPKEFSQGDLSCRRNKRTKLPSSVRQPYEPRFGGHTW
jgi:hypothetical protein